MEFSIEQIQKVARLAKIRLTDEEVALFNDQFSAIMEILTKLQSVNTEGVTPIANVSQAQLLLREDVVTDGGKVDDILFNAPDKAFNCFVVPKVVE